MKGKMVLLGGLMFLCLGLVGAPASWANSLEYQGITFGLTLDGGDLVLTMSGQGTGNWTGVNSLDQFALQNYGTAGNITQVSVSGFNNSPTYAVTGTGLDAGGCNQSSANWTCFSGSPFGTFNNTFDISIKLHAGTGAFSLTNPPSLKVLFDINGTPCAPGCDLLSKPIPVPLPGTFLMFGLGMVGLVGWHFRSRFQISPVNLAT